MKKVQELSRRVTPNANTSFSFNKRPPSINTTSSGRRSVTSRTGPTKNNTITVIKAAPKDFPKTESDDSLASSCSTNCEPEQPLSVPTPITESPSITREVSIQTTNPNGDGFLQDATICHPSIAVINNLTDNFQSTKLENEKWLREHRIRKSMAPMTGMDELGIFIDSETQMSRRLNSSHELKRSTQLAQLQEFGEKHAVSRSKTGKPFLLSEREQLIVQNHRKMKEVRMQHFRNLRMVNEHHKCALVELTQLLIYFVFLLA